jgi:hypothetical protein
VLGSRRLAGVVQRLLEDACQFPAYRAGSCDGKPLRGPANFGSGTIWRPLHQQCFQVTDEKHPRGPSGSRCGCFTRVAQFVLAAIALVSLVVFLLGIDGLNRAPLVHSRPAARHSCCGSRLLRLDNRLGGGTHSTNQASRWAVPNAGVVWIGLEA